MLVWVCKEQTNAKFPSAPILMQLGQTVENPQVTENTQRVTQNWGFLCCF